jgi:NAD(P)-dependent dehydrogenase (short-subunit alcohol dehydrogenase family)
MAYSTAKLSRVHALAPGYIDKGIMRKTGLNEEIIAQINEQATSHTPLDRKAHDIAKFTLFLGCDDSDFITGVELTVDGGWTQV